MGQAKARGSFAQRQADAISRNAAEDAAQHQRVETARLELDQWRREHPEEYKRERLGSRKTHALLAVTAALGASLHH